MSPEILLPLIPLIFAAFVLGLTGFGFGMIGIGMMALVIGDLERGAAILTIMALLVVSLLCWRSRRDGQIQWREVLLLWMGTVIGQPIGYYMIALYGDSEAFRLPLGLVMLAFAWVGWRGLRSSREIKRVWAVPIGVLSGFISGAFVSGGPPLVIYMYSKSPDDPRKMVASLQMLFLLNSIYRFGIVMYRGYGSDMDLLMTCALGIPICAIFLLLGYACARKTDPKIFAAMAYGLVVVMACIAIFRGLRAVMEIA